MNFTTLSSAFVDQYGLYATGKTIEYLRGINYQLPESSGIFVNRVVELLLDSELADVLLWIVLILFAMSIAYTIRMFLSVISTILYYSSWGLIAVVVFRLFMISFAPGGNG